MRYATLHVLLWRKAGEEQLHVRMGFDETALMSFLGKEAKTDEHQWKLLRFPIAVTSQLALQVGLSAIPIGEHILLGKAASMLQLILDFVVREAKGTEHLEPFRR